MGTSKSELRRRDVFRARVRQMLEAGHSVSRIAKETGKSLLHTTRIADQELAAMAKAGRVPAHRADDVDPGSLQRDRSDV